MIICKAAGCELRANRVGAGLCEKHYMRVRRGGSLEKRKTRLPLIIHSHGYLLEYAPDHWLTKRHTGRYEYQHRIRFYNKHGQGPFVCHWCSVGVDWDTMHVDHVDSVPTNNDISNLVASCPLCNQRRGQPRMVATWRRKSGITFNGETKTIAEWAKALGMRKTALDWRIKNGWTLEQALTAPRRNYSNQGWMALTSRDQHSLGGVGHPKTV